MSPPPTFFRLPHPAGPVLVRVAPRPSTKSRPLDLELTATDDVRAFVLPLQHSKISRFRAKGTSFSDDEWESCLSSLLLGTQPTAHLHVAAQFIDENLGIEIGNKVSGATNIAGTLVLRHSKSATENAHMFAWANEALIRQAQLAEELAELKLKYALLNRRFSDETARFAELVQSKNAFESEHDSFFRDLLNEKKLKIRTQEQILSTARVDDQAKLAALKAKASSGKSEVASRHLEAGVSSSKGKRKATSPADDTDEDDIDAMDVDEPSVSPAQGLSDFEETTEEETSEPEPDPEPQSRSPTRLSDDKKAGGGTSPLTSMSTAKSNKPPGTNLRGKSPVVVADDEDTEMPAPRALPFGKKAKPVPNPADDESTASES